MPKYTIVIHADHTGTGHSIEFEAATSWLALEKTHTRLGWLSAELLEGGRPLARVDHLPLHKKSQWQSSPPPRSATLTR